MTEDGLFRVSAGLVVFLLALSIECAHAQAPTGCSVPVADKPDLSVKVGASSAADFPVWKTIRLGEYRNVAAIRSAFDHSPCRIGLGDSVDEAIGRPTFSFTTAKIPLDLVLASVRDLGLSEDGASIDTVYRRVQSIGLKVCPPDLALVLRLTYLDQPRGEFLHIAMKPVALYSHELIDFTLGNDGTRLLVIGGDARGDLVLHGMVRFVFVRPAADTSSPTNELVKR